jgi:hypothetical protein
MCAECSSRCAGSASLGGSRMNDRVKGGMTNLRENAPHSTIMAGLDLLV